MSLPFSRQSRSGLTATPARKPRAGSFPEEHVGPLGIVFCILLLAATVLILDYGVLPPPYAERARPQHDIFARVDYRYSDPDELNRQREAAAERAPRAYVEDPVWTDKVVQDLLELIGIVEKATSAKEARERAARYPHDLDLVEALYRYNQEMGPERMPLRTMLADRIRHSLQIIAENGMLTPEDYDAERYRGGIIRIVPGAASETVGARVPVERLRNSAMIVNDELRRASWRENLPDALEALLYRHLRSRLDQNPCNLVLDPAQTARQQELAREGVGRGDVSVKKHSLILSKDRPASKSDLERLHAEYRAYKQSLPWESRVKQFVALTSVALAILLVFLFAAARGQPGVLRRRRALAMLGLLTIAVLASARGLLLAGESAALTPVVFVAIVASLAFGQTISLLTLFSLCILSTTAGVHWEAAETVGVLPALSLALMAGGIAAALPAERLQGRWDLLRYGALGGVVQGALAAGMSFLGGGLVPADAPANVIAEHAAALAQAGVPTVLDAALALINGPVCGLLVLGSLPLIESLFGILTNIRLFELADMNQPSLRRIQLEAPGTFAHTLQVRFLAEPAAAAIGANTRLVSAGVLYHDMGKVLKPEYFIENQMDAPERHMRLRPSVSALLITAHVKDGIDLAHEYGLPQQIVDFIPEHHGTTLVSYFYHSAKRNAASEGRAGNGGGAEAVQESFFRYPGPRPRSRETAIVMLADTVEAATRTLNNPNAARLRSFTHELIMEKVLGGQLDECDLTFADLALIEEAFLRVLVTRFHARIRYPGQPEEAAAAGVDAKTTIVEALPAPERHEGAPGEPMAETRFLDGSTTE